MSEDRSIRSRCRYPKPKGDRLQQPSLGRQSRGHRALPCGRVLAAEQCIPSTAREITREKWCENVDVTTEVRNMGKLGDMVGSASRLGAIEDGRRPMAKRRVDAGLCSDWGRCVCWLWATKVWPLRGLALALLGGGPHPVQVGCTDAQGCLRQGQRCRCGPLIPIPFQPALSISLACLDPHAHQVSPLIANGSRSAGSMDYHDGMRGYPPQALRKKLWHTPNVLNVTSTASSDCLSGSVGFVPSQVAFTVPLVTNRLSYEHGPARNICEPFMLLAVRKCGYSLDRQVAS